MPIEQSTFEEKLQRVRADIIRELPGSQIKDSSVIDAIARAVAGMSDELSTEINSLFRQLFLQTATGINLEKLAAIRGLSRKQSTKSIGTILVTGIVSSVIPVYTIFSSASGKQYNSTAAKTIATITKQITTATKNGDIVTITTSVAHGFSTNANVTLSGFDQAEYNAVFPIVATSSAMFTFTQSGAATPTGSTKIATVNGVEVSIQSQETGATNNILSGNTATLSQAISGVDNIAYVGFNGISGGSDTQNDDEFRKLVLSKFSEKTSPFSPERIIELVKSVQDVTRVKVKRATPSAGKVTVIFSVDNLSSPIPGPEKISQVKSLLEQKADITMENPSTDIITPSPTTKHVDFVFSTISPNTQEMKDAIIENLKSYLKDSTEIEESRKSTDFSAPIANTIDKSGNILTNFIYTSPSTTQTPVTNQFLAVGTVTFNV